MVQKSKRIFTLKIEKQLKFNDRFYLMEKIIVTGATGFIGRHAIQSLQKQGYDIHAITSKEKREHISNNITWHSVDLFDYAKVADFCRQVGATDLLHLAWYDDHKQRMTSLNNVAWVETSLHLIRKFAQNGGQKIVLAGSCAEYDWRYGYCNEERTPTNSDSIYGICKASLNNIAEKYCKDQGIKYSCGRIFSVYGSNESKRRLIPYVITSLLKGQQAKLNHVNKIRDYLHVSDVADALVTLMETDEKGAINIGSGQPINIGEIVAMIGKKLKSEELIVYKNKNSTQDQHPVIFADITKLRDELGWIPKYDLESGIDETIDWWKDRLKIKAK